MGTNHEFQCNQCKCDLNFSWQLSSYTTFFAFLFCSHSKNFWQYVCVSINSSKLCRLLVSFYCLFICLFVRPCEWAHISFYCCFLLYLMINILQMKANSSCYIIAWKVVKMSIYELNKHSMCVKSEYICFHCHCYCSIFYLWFNKK